MASAKSNRAPAQINRRNLLSAAPAAGLAGLMAGAVPAVAAADHDTPVAALFRQWEQVRADKNGEMSDDDYDVLLYRQIDIEDRIIRTPAKNSADWIMKVMAYSCLGESAITDRDDNPDLWAEARALIAA